MNEAEKNKLWKQYTTKPNDQLREQIILEYAPLVKVVAGRLSMYLGFTVEYDDLVGYGIFGLIDAIDKFDYDKGIKFETYASLRIRGSILDQIRKMDWIPRSIRQKQKKIETTYRELETTLGHTSKDEEVAKKLDISEEEFANWQSQTKISSIASLEDFVEQGMDIDNSSGGYSKGEQPEKVIEESEQKRILAETLEQLTEKEKRVILLYYYEEMTLKEISVILEVSESRVSQLHTKALQKMKKKLGNQMDIFAF